MKNSILIFISSAILTLFIFNFISNVEAQNSSFNNDTKIINNDQNSTDFIYKFEPFLLLNGKDFEDISHNNTLSLQNFAISAWIKTVTTTSS